MPAILRVENIRSEGEGNTLLASNANGFCTEIIIGTGLTIIDGVIVAEPNLVTSVNSQIGDVVLSATDVGALPDSDEITLQPDTTITTSGGLHIDLTTYGDDVVFTGVGWSATFRSDGVFFPPNRTDCQQLLIYQQQLMQSTAKIAWGNSFPWDPQDIGIKRNSAGVLEINSGTAEELRDLIARSISIEAMFRLSGYTTEPDLDEDQSAIWQSAGVLYAKTGNGEPVPLLSASTAAEWTIASAQTASFNAVANTFYPVDISAASTDITATLPASPEDGDRVGLVVVGTSVSYRVITGRNGQTLNGGTDSSPYHIFNLHELLIWQYISGGWTLTTDRRIPCKVSMRQDSSQNLTYDTDTVLTLDSTQLDIGGLAVLANDRIVARRSGYWSGQGFIGFASLPDRTRAICGIWKNGAAVKMTTLYTSYGAVVGCYFPCPFDNIPMASGDYLQLIGHWDNTTDPPDSQKATFVAADFLKSHLSISETLIG